jgi:hypothetical protein
LKTINVMLIIFGESFIVGNYPTLTDFYCPVF